MDSHCGPLCFSESGPTDSHCGLKLYCTGTTYRYRYWYHLRYSMAKSGVAESLCGVKLGAENSHCGFSHCVSSSKTTVQLYMDLDTCRIRPKSACSAALTN